MSTIPALDVVELRKTYATGVEALKGISLSVQPGDFFALLGPNGAGKSTLIGIVSSLVNATGGSVRVFGVDLHAEREAAMRLIGLVPQEMNFNLFEKPFEILDKYRVNYALLKPKWPLTYLLEHSSTWHPIYSDKVAVLFERTPTTTAGTGTAESPSELN